MIAADQPQLFPKNLIGGISSVSDGNMKLGIEDDTRVLENRTMFLSRFGISPDDVTLEQVTYNTDEFLRYQRLADDSPAIITADGLATDLTNRAIFLPLADCVGAVFYDPQHGAFMLSHLGRHSTEQGGGKASVQFMTKEFGSRPNELLIWLGPAPNGMAYPLWNCGNRSFHEELTRQLREAGVASENIATSPVDTSSNLNYFSHSEFLKGNQKIDGRYAIVAQMR